MAFLTEPLPTRDTLLPVLPGISRIVAENPGPMTYHGTNTYLIETDRGLTVLDPGPDNAAHVAAVVAAGAGRIAAIALSHTHRDHVGAVPALRAATGAPVGAFVPSALEGFAPDVAVGDGASFGGLTAIHTPGHAADHLCFAMRGQNGEKLLFSADHVMSWSSSIVSPPNGDMAAYFASLRLLLERDDDIYLPGHGPPLPNPHDLVRGLLTHRLMREAAIADALGDTPIDSRSLVDRLYARLDASLHAAAERNVLAHLLKLERDGRARREGELWKTV